MKWIFVLLLLVNAGLAGYAYIQHTRPHPDAQIMALQMNADKIRVIPEPPRPKPKPRQPERTACLEWGTFGDLELLRVREAISVLQLGDRVSERKGEVTTNWWVYMPPQSSRRRMERKADELVQLGITDFVLVSEKGRWQYAISLGAFREEEGARDYLAQLRQRGVRTGDIGRREQQVEQTTVIIRAPTPSESTQLVELATKFPGSDMRAVQCEG